jgi:transposase-like protein
LTPKKHAFELDVKMDVEARVRQGVKAVLEEEMSEHVNAGYRELTPTRRGERNGYYTRNLLTPAGTLERLEVPLDTDSPPTP